jgi:P-type Cu2+ transporter
MQDASVMPHVLQKMPSDDAEARHDASTRQLRLWDDPDEWATFSQPIGEQAQSREVWESQVWVAGMHCAACALTVESALRSIKGVLAARVSAATGLASVTWSSLQTTPSQWMMGAQKFGYALQPITDTAWLQKNHQATRLVLWRWLVAGFCMMQVMMYAAPGYFAASSEITPDIMRLLRWASWVLCLPVIFFSCGPFFRHAWGDLRHRRISMDLPIALGIVITFMLSMAATFEPQGWWGQEVYFDSLTMFVFFLLTGRWLEQKLRDTTTGALGHLMQRLPISVERLLHNGGFERIALRRLNPGDIVRVLPGDAFPADGVLVQGDTFTDEALLTGESRPIARHLGDLVIAGSYNVSTAVQVRAEQLGEHTRYAHIVSLMQRASIDKPRLVLLADQVAKPFLIFVLLAAATAGLFWWETDPARALMAAVAVLIVTCPCALSLAAPTAMLTSAAWLARQGVLVRRLQAIESLADIDTVVFDKTGTLTETKMALRTVRTRSGITQDEALQIASALAQHSLHPISRALVTAAHHAVAINKNLSVPYLMRDVTEILGQGLQGRLEGHLALGLQGVLRLGSAKFCGHDNQWPDAGQLVLSDTNGWIAQFELEETVRALASDAVAALEKLELQVQILSGDNQAAVNKIAGALKMSKAQGCCTPQSKLAHVQALQQQGHKVLMVGDGLNDGPVLAGANVSIAMGTSVPLAQAQSDFVIPGGQLQILPRMVAHARKTMTVVKQNLCWAALYNTVCIPMALAGWLPAWLAGLGMAMSSLLVLANAARLAQGGGSI